MGRPTRARKAVSAGIRALLEQQKYKCPCGEAISTSNHYKTDRNFLICGLCSLELLGVKIKRDE